MGNSIQFNQFDSGFEISTQGQKVRFDGLTERPGHGEDVSSGGLPRLRRSTWVRCEDNWEGVCADQGELLSGPDFDLIPDSYHIVQNTSRRVAVLLTGRHAIPDYTWDALVEACQDSPWIRFRITCHLVEPVKIESPEPTAALWMEAAPDAVMVDQGPVAIYGGNSWGNSFPAAYLWSAGREAIVFFNMTPSTWMSKDNLRRFLDCRITALTMNGRTGIGLHALSQSGNTLPAGHLVIEYFLLQRSHPEKPTRLQALETTLQACAALLPASAPFPENRVPPYELTWKCFTENMIKDLMVENVCWVDLPSTWTDGPAFTEDRIEVFRIHSDYAVNSSRIVTNRKDPLSVWDYATCNNFLAPWIAYLRLNPDPLQSDFVGVKVRNIPQFHDTRANLFRWCASGVLLNNGQKNTMSNGIEMSWENFMFHLETAKIHHALPADRFNPAIPGHFLMACRGLVEYAHKVNYIFPQWFDAFEKTPMVQLDLPKLGKVREPFQAGSYAYIMLDAFELSGDHTWLEEACKALRFVLTEITYTEVNAEYTQTFTDPVDIPIAETFGNGYAIAAAQRICNLTGDETFRGFARDFLNILARMAFWYDDQSDAVSQDLNNLGLFRAHGGHYGTCPWENIEAYLPVTVFLKYNRSHDRLLLKLFNLQRINSYYYYPPVWTPLVAEPNPELYYHVCQYLPIENFYTLEFGGTHGSMGRCIYMCSQAIWNYLLYEALAASDDREIMVLNLDMLDGYEHAIAGIERSFVVFNPTGQVRSFTITMNACLDGRYQVTVTGDQTKETRLYGSDELEAGLPVNLGPQQKLFITIVHEKSSEMKSQISQIKEAQGKIAHAYQLLQEACAQRGLSGELQAIKNNFLSARQAYFEKGFALSSEKAQNVIDSLA